MCNLKTYLTSIQASATQGGQSPRERKRRTERRGGNSNSTISKKVIYSFQRGAKEEVSREFAVGGKESIISFSGGRKEGYIG